MATRTSKVLAATVPLGIIASGVLVWQASYAAFSDTTTNPGNSFSAGSVKLTDDHKTPATAMFTADGLKPGSSASSCIKVTYNGTIASAVKMYVKSGDLTNTTGDLSPYLTIQVDEGTGNAADCTDFADGTNIYNPNGPSGATYTLADFATTKSTYATGASSWTPSTAPSSKTYKVTYWLQDNNLAQGKNNTVKFTWEAQNTSP